MPFGEEEAPEYGRLLAESGLHGRLRADRLIAVHAMSPGLELVTFDRGFTGLHPDLRVYQPGACGDEGRRP
ncbi:hypothetical protein [Thermaurantiacus sp.]